MPANVTVEFSLAQLKYEQAKSPQAKLEALQEMWKSAPSHKGAEKLRAEISKKIAQARHEIEKQRDQQKKTASKQDMHIKKEGCGQIALVGFPNSGKSFLLKALTNADVEVAPYPFTTKKPQVGMAPFSGTKIQVVEVPGIIEGSSEGRASGTQFLGAVRNADAIAIIVTGGNALHELGVMENELKAVYIFANSEKPKIAIKQSGFKGITVSGKKFLKIPEKEFIEFLKSHGIKNASVILGEETTIDKISETLNEKIAYKKALVLVNASSGMPEEKALAAIRKKWNTIVYSEPSPEFLGNVKNRMFSMLEKILVFTKRPGQEPDMDEPLILKEGATTQEVVRTLHKDFAQNLKFVRVWGSTRFPGQKVSKNYKMKNMDVVEISS